jgi:hypothetical protein
MTQYPETGLDNAQTHLHDVLNPAYQRFTRAKRARICGK